VTPLRHGLSFASFVLILVACGANGHPTGTLPAAPAVVSVAPATTTSAAPPDAGAAAQPKPRKPSPFHVVARRKLASGRTLDAFLLQDGTLFVAGGFAFARAPAGGDLSFEPKTSRGLPHSYSDGGVYEGRVEGIGGQWPGAAYLALTRHHDKFESASEIFRWRRDRWTRVRASPGYSSVAPWVKGTLLALGCPKDPAARVVNPKVNMNLRLPGNGPPAKSKLLSPRFELIDGAATVPLPQVDASFCPGAFTTLPSGEVIAVGSACDDSGTLAERWAAGSERGIVEKLPEDCFLIGSPADCGAIEPPTVYARSASDVWAASLCSSGLAHFDGTSWRDVDVPSGAHVTSVSGGPDGSLWLAASCDDGACVLRREPHGSTWETLLLPTASPPEETHILEYEPRKVLARSADDVWVVAEAHDTETVLLRTREAASVVEFPDAQGVDDLLSDLDGGRRR
jgi:hypothetical protein